MSPMNVLEHYFDISTLNPAFDLTNIYGLSFIHTMHWIRVRRRNSPPQTHPQRLTTLHRKWQNIPQRVVQLFIVSMHCRCQAVISARGGHNRYLYCAHHYATYIYIYICFVWIHRDIHVLPIYSFLVQSFYNLNIKIVHFFYFQNTFPFVFMTRQTDDVS